MHTISLASNRTPSLWFWIRASVVIGLLSILLPTNLLNASGASDAPRSLYQCGSPHCYRLHRWGRGPTLGTSTYIYVRPLTCGDCTTSNAQFLTEETWLSDSHYSADGDGYVEVGYAADEQHNGAMWYFYANTPHPGGVLGQQLVDVEAVPAGDYYTYSGVKITKNKQTAGHILVQLWGNTPCNAGAGCSAVVANNMGGPGWAGDLADIGSELSGTNYNPFGVFQSSNGWIFWIKNLYQTSDGVYHWQQDDGTFDQADPPEFQEVWSVRPSQSPTGGALAVSCGC